MSQRSVLVSGSSGLIGSEVCSYFGQRGFAVHGIDNNQRAVFFGPQATPGGISTGWRVSCPRSRITTSDSAGTLSRGISGVPRRLLTDFPVPGHRSMYYAP